MRNNSVQSVSNRSRHWFAATLVVALAMTFGVAWSAPAAAEPTCTSSGTPTVTTDLPDYLPNDVVQISGTGYACGSTVTVTIVPPSHVPWSTTVSIGDDGLLATTYPIPSPDNLGEYLLSVSDAAGNLLASTTFTDSHFRYGTLAWTRANLTTRSVDFTIQVAMRLGYFTNCLGTQPTVGQTIPASANNQCIIGSVNFGDGAPAAPFGINVTSVDTANDILQGFYNLNHVYPTNGTFTATWGNCCRLSPGLLQNNTDGAWNVQTLVNLNTTSGALKSPSSQLPGATPCSVGAVCVIPIPASDNDPNAATLTYRLATPAEMDGTGGSYHETQPPGSSIDTNTGVFTWPSAGYGAAGDLWDASVIIEARNAAGVIISTVQVDFLIQQITGVPPVFVFPPSPTSGSILSASVGVPFGFPLEAKSTANFPVHVNTNSTITGSTLTCPAPATPIDCTFAWTPTLNDVGPHLVSFVAQDSTGKNSATLQITIDVQPVQVYVTPDNQSKTYGDADPTFTFSTSGFLGTDGFTTAPTCGVAVAHENVNTYPITCSGGATRPGYHVNYGTATLTVSPKTLTITPDNLTVAYGDAQHFTFHTDGLVGTDTLTQDPTCDVSGQHTDVGTYTIVCSGATAGGNYVITYGTGTLTVGTRTITITANDVTATYGDTPSFTFTADGLVGTDTLSQNPTCDVSGPHANAGIYQNQIVCSGATASGNYTISYKTGTLTVTPKTITVTPDDQSKTYGDADPTFTFSVSPLVAGDTLSQQPTCGVTGAHANVNTYTIECSGGVASSNYTFSYRTATLTVNAKTVTVTADSHTITYGDPDPVFGYHNTPFVGADTFTDAPTCGVTGTHTAAGSYSIKCSGATASSNYSIEYVDGTLTVGTASIAITPDNQTITYGDPEPTFTFTHTPLPNGETLTQDPTCGVSGAHANAGTYTITCSGATASSNYTVDQTATATLTVNRKTVTVAPDNQTITYGDADPAFTFVVAGLVGTETLTHAPTCGVSGAHANAGTYTITCSGATASSNYTVDQTATATLTVNRKTVTVTPDNQTITYGEPDPTFTFHNTPFVGADTFTQQPTCGVSGAHTNAGTYTITCSGATASSNYTIAYAQGSLVVKKATVTITPNNQMKLPGEPDPTFTYQVTGLVGSDSLTTNPTCGVAGAHDTPGTYSITCSGADAGSNYVVTYGPPATLTVAKATPSLSTSPSSTVPVGGLISDSATLSGGAGPTGTITFRLYAPGDNHCNTAIATLNRALNGNTATSGTVQATQAGVYNWVATYNGDSKNNVVTGDCGSERVIVTPQVLTGRAFAVSVNSSLAGLPLLTVKPTPDTGPVSTTASGTTAPPCVANINGLAGVQAACASVVTVGGFGARSTATASVAAATISVATLPAIVVQGVQSTSTTSCAGSSGSVTISYLKVGTVVVISKPTAVAPNTMINVGVVKLVLNEQVPFTTPDAGLRVNSIHATVNAVGLATLDTVISSSESDIGNCP